MSGSQSRCRGVGDVGAQQSGKERFFWTCLQREGGREVRLPSQPLPSRILSLWRPRPIAFAEGLSVFLTW